MDSSELSELLGAWEGYRLGTVGRAPADLQRGEKPEVWIELRPDPQHPRRCSGCGDLVAAVHDTTERWVRDLPILEADTWLLVHRVRVNCPECGPRVEQLGWLDAWARFTRRFADSVVRLAAVLPLKQVAEFYELHWETVKRLHKEHLQRTLGSVDLTGIEVVAMDEFAIQKGHRYATVVVEPYRKQVLWVGRGRMGVCRCRWCESSNVRVEPQRAQRAQSGDGGVCLEGCQIARSVFGMDAKFRARGGLLGLGAPLARVASYE